MKRIQLLLILLLAMAFNLAAQDDYKPFVEQGKRWVCKHEHEFMSKSYVETYQYVIKGDTVIDGTTYARVLKLEEGQFEEQVEPYCYVREEGHKVYVINPHHGYQNLKSDVWPTYDDYEWTLYDFDDPNSVIAEPYRDFVPIAPVQGRKAFGMMVGMIIEGIGYYTENDNGDPFTFILDFYTCLCNDIRTLQFVEDAQGNIIFQNKPYYPRLVREGVQWHYCVYDPALAAQGNDYPYTTYRMEIRGDTVVEDYFVYKKCYRYTEEQLDTTKYYPVAYIRELYDKVIELYLNPYYSDDYLSRAYLIDEKDMYPDGYTIDGQKMLYYYNGESLYNKLNQKYGLDLTVTGSQKVTIKNYTANCYFLSGSILSADAKFVESVGIDGSYTGDLISPFIRRSDDIVSDVVGLQKLTDLKGNILYKGALYRDPYGDLTGDGRVDVADLNAAVSAVLGLGDNAKADVNGDDKVDVADINAIINVMLNR